MATIDTVYVLGGGEYMMNVFNGVAALIGSDSWTSMYRIALTLSGVAVLVSFMKAHDPKELLKFVVMMVMMSSILLVPKHTVHIIDRANPTGVYLVENVPVGLAVPARFITSIGTSLTEAYETVFHTPDALTYSKTGMLFGADLVGNVSDILSVDGDLAELMGLYTKNCVIGDILINHKYSFQELMNSRDPYTLIFQKPSPLRGIIVPNGNSAAVGANGAAQSGFWTCEDMARRVLMPKLNLDATTGGKTWNYTVKQIFGGRPDANVLYASMLGDSYNFYYQGGESASQLMRSSVVMNALKQGISGYSAQSGDTASLVNLASTSSYNKMRLSWATSSQVAVAFVPILNTILLSLVIALFPIFILLVVIHTLTGRMLFNYIMSIIYLQSWPPMFAILNYATSFYLRGKTGGMDFNLANQASIQQMHSDIGLIAGWLSISIPFIALAIVKGVGPAIAQAGNYLGTAINSSATATSSQAADGNWSFNNMQTGNVSGNKWDTNASFRDGQMTRQLSSGATSTLTSNGQEVVDTSGAMSRMAVSIKGSDAMVSSLQQSARHAKATAAASMNAYQSSVNSAWNQASQFSKQYGNSATDSTTTDSGVSSSQTEGFKKLINATETRAKNDNISNEEAFSKLVSENLDVSSTKGAKAEGGLSLPVIGGAQGYIDGNTRDTDSSQSSVQDRGARHKDARSEASSQTTRDFNEALDMINNSKLSEGTNRHDNQTNSEVEQFGATLNIAKNQYEQYSRSTTESQEYSDMASFAQNNSAQIDRNLDQEFASYVRRKAPSYADEILGNTSDMRVAKERDALAQSFVKERLLPQLESDYAQNREKIDAKDASMSTGHIPSSSALISEYQSNDNRIKTMSTDADIKHDTAQTVQSKEALNKENIVNIKGKIEEGKNKINQNNQNLNDNYKKVSDDYYNKIKTEKDKLKEKGIIVDDKKIENKVEPKRMMTLEEYNKRNSD
ncbi:conjugal transfer mating pair stabilization protein TraG (plasmid) [Providencia alcalifaciens]|uniref:TraG-like N-terminal domain protein n=1 Tax=Providencia alcalifaciens 205/92 TaxID=1256988 RepID=A0AAV3M7G3_9GAMM|nr:conjugal transfer mating-pair stabilization protein TraG [Providencia alcalifaciens]EUD11668.1 TraG-like N-terminal domain protein [Providencia alcalifaciens 205/92]WGZ56281.1 conjugal transfer mating pair stabilization protein TraG [Providencia alcalifaciens]